jgi:aryl-alcohol dehydrogenase-like predicted oxidoreductase
MRYLEVGGVRLSAIGLGTWQFGSREWGYGDAYAEGTAVEIVHRALDLGINVIDTAEIYAFGRSERIVGRAISARRDEAFVATKVFPVLPLAPVVEQRGRASAGRLGVEEIDLYQVHWPNPLVPLGQTMEGMARLQRAGRVRHVGVSNFDLGRWKGAEAALGGPVLTNQVQYSLVTRKPDRELLGWAQANDRVVIAYSPLAQGFLSAKYDVTNVPGGVRAGNSLFLPENLERAQPLFAALREVAARHDATPSQIALAWVLRRPNVVAIPGASSVAQLEANAAAADLELSDDDDRRLTEASDAFTPVSGPPAMAQLLRNRLSGVRTATSGG